jgi:hypothetical protein
MIISFIPDAFQSSSNRYRVKGAIATRCSSWVGPTARGWNRRDIVVDSLSVMRDDADADAVVGVVICGFLQYLSICYMCIYILATRKCHWLFVTCIAKMTTRWIDRYQRPFGARRQPRCRLGRMLIGSLASDIVSPRRELPWRLDNPQNGPYGISNDLDIRDSAIFVISHQVSGLTVLDRRMCANSGLRSSSKCD